MKSEPSPGEIPYCRYDVCLKWTPRLRRWATRRLVRSYDFSNARFDDSSLTTRWRCPVSSYLDLLAELEDWSGAVDVYGFIVPAGSGRRSGSKSLPLGDPFADWSAGVEAGRWYGKVWVDWRDPDSLEPEARAEFMRAKPWTMVFGDPPPAEWFDLDFAS